jgi:heme-degrading monooxygenase HmoA
MIVTVFRSRLRPEHTEAYFGLADEMDAEAAKMPGFISRKAFVAEDGERVTIVEFESEETHRAWAEHPGHRTAQKRGRADFYAEYSIHICKTLSSNTFKHAG